MQFINQYLEEELYIKPLGTVTFGDVGLLPECDYSGEEIIINGKSTNIYVAHIDYANWLEKRIIQLQSVIEHMREERDKQK